jgi:hypothetical protein
MRYYSSAFYLSLDSYGMTKNGSEKKGVIEKL